MRLAGQLPLVVGIGAPAAMPGEPPDWVAAWGRGRLARPDARKAEAAGGSAKPVDEKAQAKRRQARDDRVAAALDELDLWLCDLMRRGLAGLRGEPYAFWDRAAGRLVDGQAPGFARRVRALAGLATASSQGGAALAVALGRLGLLVRAARRLHILAPGQAASVRAEIGYSLAAEELAAQPGVEDDWAVLAQLIEEEGKLTTRSLWLAGRRGGRLAQLLDFGAAGAPLPPVPAVGQDFRGTLAFHPGDPPLRAVRWEGRAAASPPEALPGAATVRDALVAWADVLARAPWTERWPLRLRDVRLGLLQNGGKPGAGDAAGCLALTRDGRWRALVAVAGGRPVDLLGLYDGRELRVLSLLRDGRLYTLPVDEARPFLRRAA